MKDKIDRRLNNEKCEKCFEGCVVNDRCANPSCSGDANWMMTEEFGFWAKPRRAASYEQPCLYTVMLERRRARMGGQEETFWVWGDPEEEYRLAKEVKGKEQAERRARLELVWNLFMEELEESRG